MPICVTCDKGDKSIVVNFEQKDKKPLSICVTRDKDDKSIVVNFEQLYKK